MGEVAALANQEEDHGWAVLATTVPMETYADAEMLEAYQEQNTPRSRTLVEPCDFFSIASAGWTKVSFARR